MAWKQADKRDQELSPPPVVASFLRFHTSDEEENKLSMNSMVEFLAPKHKCQASVLSLVIQIPVSLDL